jgi:hypothetical protein
LQEGPNVHALSRVKFMKSTWNIKSFQHSSFFFEFQSSFSISKIIVLFRVYMFTHKLKCARNSSYLEWHF